jgi:hypothetical protein
MKKMDHKFLNNLEHIADEFFYIYSDFGSTIYIHWFRPWLHEN